MHDRAVAELEAPIRAAWEKHELEAAVRLTLELYGPELLQYLIARLRGYDDGWDAYGAFAEDLWRGMEKFEWRSSMRCWAYTLARNASNRHARAQALRARKRAGEGGSSQLSALADPARSDTKPYLQTALKREVRGLRELLTPAEQELLTLRVDRKLSWGELARVLHEGEEPTPAELARDEAKLRKRYERITRQLRVLARSQGLLD